MIVRALIALMLAWVLHLGIVESAETNAPSAVAAKPDFPKSRWDQMSPEEYLRSHEHRRHAPGAPEAVERRYYERRLRSELEEVFNYLPARSQVDRAWTVMLLKQGLISKETAVKLLTALEGADQQKGYGGEYWLKQRLDGDEDTGVVACKGEPHGDMLPIYEGYRGALRGLCHAERALGNYSSILPAIEPDKERMLHLAREGFSAAPDLAVKLIRDKGYGSRRAHRICSTFVRIARDRGIKPYETTGELLDEAARIVEEEPPRLSTEEVRGCLDPVQFIKRHNNLGDPAPEESRRMIRLRRGSLVEARDRHAKRIAQIEAAARRLNGEVAAIVGRDGRSE